MPAYTVRLASVFGPMDRATPFRNVRNAANHIAHAAAAGRPVRATTADAVGDYIYAPDVADAIHRMLAVRRERLKHPVYNLAYGEPKDISELVAVAAGENAARPQAGDRPGGRGRHQDLQQAQDRALGGL